MSLSIAISYEREFRFELSVSEGGMRGQPQQLTGTGDDVSEREQI